MKKLAIWATLSVGLVLALPAAAVQRIYVTNATGVCQGALPAFETAIRKRPTAVANEGTSTAFVSCSFSGDNAGTSSPPVWVALYASNRGAVQQTLNCSLVDGTNLIGGPPPLIIPKSVVIAAGTTEAIVWDPAIDNGGMPFTKTNNLSCQLAPRVELNLMGYPFEDGSAATP